MEADKILFREDQPRRHPRMWFVVWTLGLGAFALLAWMSYTAPAELLPKIPAWAFWTIMGVLGVGWLALAWWALASRMETRVTPRELDVTYRPLGKHIGRIETARIRSAVVVNLGDDTSPGPDESAREAQKRQEFRTGSGDRAVRLTLTDGQTVLIGSQRPEELSQAIQQARAAA